MSSELDQLLQSGNITVAIDLQTLRKIFAETIAKLQPPDDPTGPDRFLTKKEVSEMLSVNQSTIWRWQRSGYLVPLKIGGLVRYRESDILKLMEGNSDE